MRAGWAAAALGLWLLPAGPAAADPAPPGPTPPRIGVVMPDDRGETEFVRLAWSGVRAFQIAQRLPPPVIARVGVELADDEVAALLSGMVRDGRDPIVVLGSQFAAPLRSVASAGGRFVLVANAAPLANVESLEIRAGEGGFLAGAAAAAASRSGRVGFIGGMDVDLIRQFECGFRLGARFERPGADVQSLMLGDGADAFFAPERAERVARSMLDSGADVIFHAAGASGQGLFRVARTAAGLLAIGIDGDETGKAPGRVLTSLVIHYDRVVELALQAVEAGQWARGPRRYGVADGAFELVDGPANRAVYAPAARAAAARASRALAAGGIAPYDDEAGRCAEPHPVAVLPPGR